MKIRQVGESDIKDLLSLIRAKADFDGCLEYFKADETDIREAFFSGSPKAKAIIADLDGKVIGVATYYYIYSTFIAKPGIWLDDLFVYEEYRKAGVGKALIKSLCSIANQTGCGRIDWIVAIDNKNGREFYDSIGARVFEEVRHSRLDENAINKLSSVYK